MDYLDHSSSQNAESASLAGKEKITERQGQALRRSIGISAQVLLSVTIMSNQCSDDTRSLNSPRSGLRLLQAQCAASPGCARQAPLARPPPSARCSRSSHSGLRNTKSWQAENSGLQEKRQKNGLWSDRPTAQGKLTKQKPQRGAIWTSSASCSLVSWVAVNLSATASFTMSSRPVIRSGLSASFGKKPSRVRRALASGIFNHSA